jgi:hypothetical protein
VVSGPACPVCGTGLQIPLTGRRPRYCGKPCRQAAYRARLAAGRAAETAARVRRELAGLGEDGMLAGADQDLGRALLQLQGAAARIRDCDGLLPDAETVPGGWEDAMARQAKTVIRLAHRVADLAAVHARAAADFQAAQTVFRRGNSAGPGGDETLQSSVLSRRAADRATKPGGPAGLDRDAVFDAVEDTIYAVDPGRGQAVPEVLEDAVADLAEVFARQAGDGPLGELAAAAAKVVEAARGCTGLPGEVATAVGTLAAVLPATREMA